MNIHLALPVILTALRSERNQNSFLADPCEDAVVAAFNCFVADEAASACMGCIFDTASATLDGTEESCADVNDTDFCTDIMSCATACQAVEEDTCAAEIEAAVAACPELPEEDPVMDDEECCGGAVDRAILQIA